MDAGPPGLIRASFTSMLDLFRSSRTLRREGLAVALLYAAFSAALCASGLDALRGRSDILLYYLTLPQQFLLYDAMLGLRPPYPPWRRYLDPRLYRCCACFALCILASLPLAVIVGMASGALAAWSEGHAERRIVGVALCTALAAGSLALMARIMFFPVLIALGRRSPMRASFRETRGKLMRIARRMFFPYLAGLAVCLLGTKALAAPAGSGLWRVAAFSAADAAFICALSLFESALFVHVYRDEVCPPPDPRTGPPIDEDAFARPPKSQEEAAQLG